MPLLKQHAKWLLPLLITHRKRPSPLCGSLCRGPRCVCLVLCAQNRSLDFNICFWTTYKCPFTLWAKTTWPIWSCLEPAVQVEPWFPNSDEIWSSTTKATKCPRTARYAAFSVLMSSWPECYPVLRFWDFYIEFTTPCTKTCLTAFLSLFFSFSPGIPSISSIGSK